ncbi:MAG: alpha/beta hydrolase [Gordonia sp. (in: high G+C Gram-positive bacteria)]
MAITAPTTLMRRGYVDVSRGQLHYRERGTGSTTVVLLHQTASSGAMYEAFVEECVAANGESAYRFIAFDTPGFGHSFRPAEHYDIGDFANDFIEALDALGVGDFHVLGHHTGVAMAARLGASRPDRVRSVTMFGPLALTVEQRAKHFDVISPIVYEESGHYMIDVWQYAAAPASPFPPNLDLHHREVVDKLYAGNRFHEAYETVFTTDIGADIARVSAPLLLLTTEDDDLYAYLDQTIACNPSMVVRVLDAGVYVFDQDPALVASTIGETGLWA